MMTAGKSKDDSYEGAGDLVNLRGNRGGRLLVVDGDGHFVAGFLTEDEVLAGDCGA